MAFLSFRDIGITALSAAIPKNIINNYNYTTYFPKDDVKKIVDKIGIYERRFADEHTCASDLCYAAAEKLFADNNINRDDIDVLIFISQTPDYRMPATSILLQDRLKLPQTCIAFDISLGCSAFLYGLTVAFSYLQNDNIRKILILNGETRSKVYSPKDRRTAFLFGDGGVAALIEKNNKFGPSYFSLNSDGGKADLIKINGGGYRNPSSSETIKEKIVDEYGNIRSDENGYMNGEDVFNFVIRAVPTDIKKILEFSNISSSDIDYYIFHQANKFINSYIINKMKLDRNKIPSTIEKYGNVSSVSVPLTIISELKNAFICPQKLLLSAFGVGMTWASGIITLDNCKISDIVEI